MRPRQVPVVVLTAGLTLAACADESPGGRPASSESPTATITVAAPLRCDVDRGSEEAKDVIERVGGLHGAGYTVRFAQSTELGVVALVEGDLVRAGADLIEGYGVSVVTPWDPTVEEIGKGGFRQIERVVTDHCP